MQKSVTFHSLYAPSDVLEDRRLGVAGWLVWMPYMGGLLAAALIGYRIGVGRGRRRERRARALNDRLQTAVTGLPDPPPAPPQPRAVDWAAVRSKPPCLM